MLPFEMVEEVGGVSFTAEDWSQTYSAPNTSLSLVLLMVAEPFPNI